jgi:hypothetical protein
MPPFDLANRDDFGRLAVAPMSVSPVTVLAGCGRIDPFAAYSDEVDHPSPNAAGEAMVLSSQDVEGGRSSPVLVEGAMAIPLSVLAWAWPF